MKHRQAIIADAILDKLAPASSNRCRVWVPDSREGVAWAEGGSAMLSTVALCSLAEADNCSGGECEGELGIALESMQDKKDLI